MEVAADVAQAELLAQFADGDAPVDQPGAVGTLHDVVHRPLMLLGQNARDGGHDVGQRDDAEEVAVFVHHECDMQRDRAEHLEHAQDGDALGHIDRLLLVGDLERDVALLGLALGDRGLRRAR